MEISSSVMANQRPKVSVLNSANRQPELAGELIRKTMEGLLDLQSAQTTPQLNATSPLESVPGQIINIVA